MKVAIVGDFSSYQSNSLNAFMYESNQGNMVLFKETESDALEALHQISARKPKSGRKNILKWKKPV
jgi:hypothetical protein